MSKGDLGFRVFINEGELDQIHSWVRKHNDIETGGDLFGLWIDEHTAAVQFVLGPGKDCSRTSTSFFQDVSYLKNAGFYLTTAHGLCNIGQWHSHHRIGLFKPSAGDDNTVWNNMPGLGLDRYIVFIANIKNSDKVEVNCFLYQIKNGRALPVDKGKFHKLYANSPLRLNENLLQHIYIGAESFNHIPVFEKEKQKIINNDEKGNLNTSVENESESGNYTGNGVQNISKVSSRQRDDVSNYNAHPRADKTKKLENNQNKPAKAVSVYHIPSAQRQDTVARFEDQGGSSTKQRNHRDTQQDTQIQRNELRAGTRQQVTNTASNRGTHNSPNVDKTWKHHNRPITRTTNDQDPKMDSVPTVSKKTQKVGHSIRTTITDIQGTQPVKITLEQQKRTTSPIRNSHDPQRVDRSLLETRKKQEHSERTHTTTKTLQNCNFPTTPRSSSTDWERENKATTNTEADNKGTNSHELLQQDSSETILQDVKERHEDVKKIKSEERDPVSSTNNLQRKVTTVQYNTSKGVTVIVEQPERHSLKRKSVYDNVESDNNERERKKGRPITELIENQPTVDGRPNTPSGTISAEEYHRKSKQNEKNCDSIQSASSWTDSLRSLCCGMSKLSIEDEPKTSDVKENPDNNMDGDVKTKHNIKMSYV